MQLRKTGMAGALSSRLAILPDLALRTGKDMKIEKDFKAGLQKTSTDSNLPKEPLMILLSKGPTRMVCGNRPTS